MFATDGTRIFYPTAPDRVFSIRMADLAAWDGSDDMASEDTSISGVAPMLSMPSIAPMYERPSVAPEHFIGGLRCMEPLREEGPWDAEDFADALEMWADWCDRQSEAMDAADALAVVSEAA
jgi:hypothetical protein